MTDDLIEMVLVDGIEYATQQEVAEYVRRLEHDKAKMAGDFSALASMLDEVDVPETPDGVLGRVRLLIDSVKEN